LNLPIFLANQSGMTALPAHLLDRPAFLAAMRHSQRVRLLRRAIPLICVLTLGFFGLSLVLDLAKGPVKGVGMDNIRIEGSKIAMEKPRLSGFKRDGRSYEITATTALQDLKSPNQVELTTLKARIQTGNDGWAHLSAATGLYDSKSERLEVAGGVLVKTESGLDATLKDAAIDLKAGTVLTQKPVEVRMPQGQVFADTMRIIDNGRQIVFDGKVRSVYVNTVPPQ
jgi:lipopolysaccharide export system protein LptC